MSLISRFANIRGWRMQLAEASAGGIGAAEREGRRHYAIWMIE